MLAGVSTLTKEADDDVCRLSPSAFMFLVLRAVEAQTRRWLSGTLEQASCQCDLPPPPYSAACLPALLAYGDCLRFSRSRHSETASMATNGDPARLLLLFRFVF